MFDTLEKILFKIENIHYNPYVKHMTIDDSLLPFLQMNVHFDTHFLSSGYTRNYKVIVTNICQLRQIYTL